MKNMPERIKNIGFGSNVCIHGYCHEYETFSYTVNAYLSDAASISCRTSRYSKITEETVEANENFVNGFKLVQLKVIPDGYTKVDGLSNKFAYIDEKTGKILPFYFDVATDFDEYGFAIVGIGGKVTMIDKNFNHVQKGSGMISGDIDCQFSAVTRFSDGKNPLAKLWEGGQNGPNLYYLRTDGTLQTFYAYRPSGINTYGSTRFNWGTEFDQEGFAQVNENTCLLESGIGFRYAELTQLLGKDKTFAQLEQEALKALEVGLKEKQEDDAKTLVKTL